MSVSSDLLAELLQKPVGQIKPKPRELNPNELTREISVTGNAVTATLVDQPGAITEGTALDFIKDEGLNPDEWEISTWHKSQWGSADNPMESVKYTFKRRQQGVSASLDLDELLEVAKGWQVQYEPSPRSGDHGFLVLLGDMQFGKIDGDGVEGTVRRTIECINRAAEELELYRSIYDIGHVHIAWLGDHIEGFVSQGGANVWRTTLTMSEQIRITRRVMMHALLTFAPLAEKVTMAAVPGNHGEPVRFEGTGLTRYDDSHDTESLIAVADTARMMPDEFGHVEFFVPDTDELIVVTEVAGTVIAHAHGHKFGSKKDAVWEWWKGQAFNPDSPMHMADLLVAGHLHHEHIEANGHRTFIQVPAMESESTWFRHLTGTAGSPGLIVAITKDGHTPVKQLVAAGKG